MQREGRGGGGGGVSTNLNLGGTIILSGTLVRQAVLYPSSISVTDITYTGSEMNLTQC